MIFYALAVCAVALSAQDRPVVTAQQRLRIDIVFHGITMTPRFERTAMAEAAQIWARYGVDVRASGASEAGQQGAIRLDVVFNDRIRQQKEIYTLGTILFVEGEPSTRIVMFPDAIAMLVDVDALMDHGVSHSPFFREQRLGRATGRALAHEIGHFLLRSRDHARTGLMRATPLVSDLVNPQRDAFFLSTSEIEQLHALPAWPCQGERSAGGGLRP